MRHCGNCSADLPSGSQFCLHCGSALNGAPLETVAMTMTMTTAAPKPKQPQHRFEPGSLIASRYRIISRLGKGGMGEVFRADDILLGQPVALKFLPESARGNLNLLTRFYDEVRIARQITHANVCRVYDIGEVEGQPYLSMEYIDGEDLASLLRRIGRLPADKATEFARKMCAGLAAAHSQGVLHRDLKPGNIMIDGRGELRIADFGLAAVASQLEETEFRHGTPAYMAPEQLEGREVSVQSDLYALGLVFYEMFTGKPAHKADTAAEMLKLRKESTVSDPSSLISDLDPSIERASNSASIPIRANVRHPRWPWPLRCPAAILWLRRLLPARYLRQNWSRPLVPVRPSRESTLFQLWQASSSGSWSRWLPSRAYRE
jgi:serine/threonine protein kinase